MDSAPSSFAQLPTPPTDAEKKENRRQRRIALRALRSRRDKINNPHQASAAEKMPPAADAHTLGSPPASPKSPSGPPPKPPLAAGHTPPPPLTQFFPIESGTPSGVAQRKRKTAVYSFFLCVALPFLLAIFYFGIVASDQYSSLSQFIIHTRSLFPTGSAAASGAGMTVVNPLALSDMLVVQDYVGSHQIIQDIGSDVDIRAMYSTEEADWIARLKPAFHFRRLLNGEVFSKGLRGPVSDEQFLAYWRSMVSVKFDMTTGIATLQVKAFTAPDALRIADVVLDRSEKLVNKLSERSLEDSLKFAKQEVEEAQLRAVSALDDLQSFQSEAKEVDPEGYAVARGVLQAKLDADLSMYQSQLELLRKNLPENAPGILQLKSKILVVQNQIEAEREKSTSLGENASASHVLNEFAKKKLEVDFGTHAYLSALKYLETARASAMQQSRYLEAFVRPRLPQEAEFPKRLRAVFFTLLAAFLLWAIGYLLIAAAKEHV